MQVEHRILVNASAERVFALYQDVAGWPTWDPDTRAAQINGPFAEGARGTLTPTRGRRVPMQITRVEPNRCFTVECRIPLLRMVFEHELQPQGTALEVVHRARFCGLLAPLLGRLVAGRVDRGLPVTLARLKRLAEGGG